MQLFAKFQLGNDNSGGILRALAKGKFNFLTTDLLSSVCKSEKANTLSQAVSRLGNVLKQATGIEDNPFQRKRDNAWELNFRIEQESNPSILPNNSPSLVKDKEGDDETNPFGVKSGWLQDEREHTRNQPIRDKSSLK